jgi:hypothetical protein
LTGDSFDAIQNCSVINGSLFVHATSGDVDDIIIPDSVKAITGGLYCSGAAANYSTDTIKGDSVSSIAGDSKDTSIGQIGMVISDYVALATFSFPSLQSVGSNLVLARNPVLTTIDGLQSLGFVNGNLDITGSFDTLLLPALAKVNGKINIQTNSSSFVCPSFSNVTVQGSITCLSKIVNPQPLSADNATTNTTLPASVSIPSLLSSSASSASSLASSIKPTALSSASSNPSASVAVGSSASGTSATASAAPDLSREYCCSLPSVLR